MNHGGFSWRRFIGITQLKRKIGSATGIPFTRYARQAKFNPLKKFIK